MAIKKSTLEQKWYYRLAKVFFLILPLLIAALFILRKGIVVCNSLIQEDIFDLYPNYIIFIAVALILYFLLLKWIWRGFLYIVFGGLEDDTKKKESDQSAQVTSEPSKIMQLIPILIVLGIFIIFILSEMGYITLPKISPNPIGNPTVRTVPKSTCFATSAQMATPCNSVKNGIKTSGVIVPASCNCPSDTTYAQMDNVTAGGPYKICTCN